MAAPTGDRVIAEFVLERHVHRAREVALQVRRMAVGLVEPPAHIEDRHGFAGVDEVDQLGGGDQHMGARVQRALMA